MTWFNKKTILKIAAITLLMSFTAVCFFLFSGVFETNRQGERMVEEREAVLAYEIQNPPTYDELLNEVERGRYRETYSGHSLDLSVYGTDGKVFVCNQSDDWGYDLQRYYLCSADEYYENKNPSHNAFSDIFSIIILEIALLLTLVIFTLLFSIAMVIYYARYRYKDKASKIQEDRHTL